MRLKGDDVMTAKKTVLSPLNSAWCLEGAEFAKLSFIYSICLPLTSFKELPDKKEWSDEVKKFGDKNGFKPGELKPGDGIPCGEAKFTRKGFDPILNNRLASNNQRWFCGTLEIENSKKKDAVESDPKKSCLWQNLVAPSLDFLVRFNGIGACTVTLTITFRDPKKEQLFTILDFARKDPSIKIKTRFRWTGNSEYSEYTLNEIFQEISKKIVQWQVSETHQEEEPYQCPYIVSYIKIPHKSNTNKLPWEPESFFEDNNEDKELEKTREFKQILAILIRPKIWKEYGDNFNDFRVPYHLLKKRWFASHDFFWDKRGMLLFDQRSTLFLDALPKNLKSSLSDPTFASLMDILETIRARWHFFIELNNNLDLLTKNIGDPSSLLRGLASLRKQFTKSLTYTLPYSQTASHLVELASEAEKELMVENLEKIAIRKFEAANWLYTDSTETERLAWMGTLGRDVDLYTDRKVLRKEIDDVAGYLERLRAKHKSMQINPEEEGD